jgi:hypothetical protein
LQFTIIVLLSSTFRLIHSEKMSSSITYSLLKIATNVIRESVTKSVEDPRPIRCPTVSPHVCPAIIRRPG